MHLLYFGWVRGKIGTGRETIEIPDGITDVKGLITWLRGRGEGYAKALEAFDLALPGFEALLRPGDLAVITADHGCDPTWPGHDHTREHVPLLVFGPGIAPESLGARQTFADIGQTLACHLGIGALPAGNSFWSDVAIEQAT